MVLIFMKIKDRSNVLVEVDFDYFESIICRFDCRMGDDYVILADPETKSTVEVYDLFFDDDNEKNNFIKRFSKYQVVDDLDELVGTWDMTLEG